MGNTKTSIGLHGVKDWHYETQDPFWPSTRQLTQMTDNGTTPDPQMGSKQRISIKVGV